MFQKLKKTTSNENIYQLYVRSEMKKSLSMNDMHDKEEAIEYFIELNKMCDKKSKKYKLYSSFDEDFLTTFIVSKTLEFFLLVF